MKNFSGEIIELNCVIVNSSTVSVTPKATFYQTQILIFDNRHKTVQTTFEPTIGTQVEAIGASELKVKNAQTLLLIIPQSIPLSIKSSILTVKYFVDVTLDIPHSFDLHINLPIIITTKSALLKAK